jgi:hypothetical protein
MILVIGDQFIHTADQVSKRNQNNLTKKRQFLPTPVIDLTHKQL